MRENEQNRVVYFCSQDYLMQSFYVQRSEKVSKCKTKTMRSTAVISLLFDQVIRLIFQELNLNDWHKVSPVFAAIFSSKSRGKFQHFCQFWGHIRWKLPYEKKNSSLNDTFEIFAYHNGNLHLPNPKHLIIYLFIKICLQIKLG